MPPWNKHHTIKQYSIATEMSVILRPTTTGGCHFLLLLVEKTNQIFNEIKVGNILESYYLIIQLQASGYHNPAPSCFMLKVHLTNKTRTGIARCPPRKPLLSEPAYWSSKNSSKILKRESTRQGNQTCLRNIKGIIGVLLEKKKGT